MRHLKHRHELGVKTAHRKALLANLACALIREGRIETTLAKARALRPFIEKIITLAKRGTLADRRIAGARLRDKKAVQALFNDKVDEFKDRPGGYTRIYKLGNRLGDAAEMALIELIPASDEGYGKKRKKKAKKAAAKKAVVEEVAEEAAADASETPDTEVEDEKSRETASADEASAEAKVDTEDDSSGGEEETKK